MKIRLLSACLFTVVITHAQNVGIGTATPGVPLHIYNSSTDELVRVQGNNPYVGFRTLAGNLKSYVQGYGDHLYVGTANGNLNGDIRFYNNNVPNMVIRYDGRVGIGNLTPLSPLSFSNTLGNKISFWNVGPNIDYGIGLQSGTLQFYTGSFDKMAFGYGSSNAFTETMSFYPGSGQLSLGTTIAAAKLHIANTGEALRLSGSQPYLTLYSGSNYKGYLWNKGANDIELGTASENTAGNLILRVHGVDGMTVLNDGRVRVGPLGCTTPANGGLPKFSTFGSFGIKKDYGDFIGEWAIVYIGNDLAFYYNGGIKADVNDVDGEWRTYSDRRLKENLKSYKSVLDEVKKLEVLTYHYKADQTRTTSFGLVAQNVQQYFPEIVSSVGPDKILAIAYAKTGVLAIKAIQEQQVMIEILQKEIETLKTRLTASGIK